MLKRAAIALAFALLALPAEAAWRAIDGIDVASGKPSLLLIGDLDPQTSLYARCVDGNAELFLDSYDGRDGELVPVGETNLIVSTDAGATWQSEARYAREKPGYVTTTWLTRETISRVVNALAEAKAAISIAVEYAETGDLSQWDTDARGSTAAGRKFLAACPMTGFSNLPTPVRPQVPAIAPSQPPAALPTQTTPGTSVEALPRADWTVGKVDGKTVTYTGSLDASHFVFFTCANGFALARYDGLSDPPPLGLSYPLHVELDGMFSWTGETRVTRLSDGFLSHVYYPTMGNIQDLIEALAEVRTRIDIRLEDGAADSHWSLNADGVAATARDYIRQCAQQQAAALEEQTNPKPVSDGPWSLTDSTDASGGLLRVLAANNEAGDGRLSIMCSSSGAYSISYVTSDTGSAPAGRAVSLNMVVGRSAVSFNTIGTTASATQTYFLVAEDEKIATVVSEMLAGPNIIIVSVYDGQAGLTHSRALDLANAAYQAQLFAAGCATN